VSADSQSAHGVFVFKRVHRSSGAGSSVERGLGDLARPPLKCELGLEVGVVAVRDCDGPLALEHRDEAVHELAIQLAPSHPPQLGDRVLGSHRRAVGFARRERVVRRADRDDARGKRDLVADQTGRVAAAVDVLVVVEDRVCDRAIAVEPADERSPILRMAADHRPVLIGEDLGVQDAVGQRELADVVQQPSRMDEILLGLVTTQLADSSRA